MLLALFAASITGVATDIYVAPNGSDQGNGSKAAPFRTVERALAVPRSEKAITIHLKAGEYFLTKPLHLSPVNSNLSIVADGKGLPIVSGGMPIHGWKKQGELWTAAVPESVTVNQLFVNGVRYRRPRFPESGYFGVREIDANADRAKNGEKSIGFRAGDINPSWYDLGAIEVLVFQNWTITRLPIAKVDAEENWVEFTGATLGAPWALLHPGSRFLVENVREALKRPGQFYFDRKTHQLSVIPEIGVKLDRASVIVPALEQVVEVSGTVEKPVHNVKFRGVAIRHTAWSMPPTGRNFPQAEADLGGAVLVQNARNILFEKCEISHTGGYGLEIGDHAQDVGFENGSITDLGAGGVKIGIMSPREDEATVTQHNQIKGNLIAGGGRVHPAAVGVWIGQSPHNRVEDNEIADFYYTGVSIGWTWGYGLSNAHHNAIEGNHIYNIGQGVLSDMGGIYHLGIAKGTTLSRNRIHDVTSFDYGGWGLYTDEGSSGVLLEDNIVYRCSRQSFHQHYGRDNIVRRNILAFAGEAQLARTRNEEHRSFTLENNIVIWQKTPTLWGNWDGNDAKVAMDHNLYWRSDAQPILFGTETLEQWQKRGRDLHSQNVDPLFVDPARDDFRLRVGSPAIPLGFKAMDPRGKPWPIRWKMPTPSFPIKP